MRDLSINGLKVRLTKYKLTIYEEVGKDVSEKDASTLIAMGKAREATAEDEAAPACPPTPPAAKPKAKKVKSILEEVNGTE